MPSYSIPSLTPTGVRSSIYALSTEPCGRDERVRFFYNRKEFDAEEVGVLAMKRTRTREIRAGNVGYLIAGAKDVHDTKVGDTITHASPSGLGAAPGVQRRQADGLQRRLSHQR